GRPAWPAHAQNLNLRKAKPQNFMFEKQSRKFSFSKSNTATVHFRKAKPQLLIFEKQNRNFSYSKSKTATFHFQKAKPQIAICPFIIFQEYNIPVTRTHSPGENALRWLKMKKCVFLKTLSSHGKNRCFRHLGAKS
ncbi:MAG: hypothetical protein VXW26_10895, partial [SAR324 cluster bacterium]|nr:hypothetical protein [SAR324 cluster bacterium]